MRSRSRLTFDRWDFLATRVALATIAVATTVFAVVLPVVQWLRGQPLSWRVETHRETTLSPTDVTPRDGVELVWPGSLDVSIPEASAWAWSVSLLPGLAIAAIIVTVVGALWRLLGQIQAGRPFGASSVALLRTIGGALMTGALLLFGVTGFANGVVLEAAAELSGPPILTFEFQLPALLLTGGLVVAAMAEAFAYGTELADDVEGLV